MLLSRCWSKVTATAACLVLLSLGPTAQAQLTSKTPKADADEAPQRVQRLDEMRSLASALSFDEPDGTPSAKHELVTKPLLRYSDADRGVVDGALWAYGREGRPVALLEVYCGRYIPTGVYRHPWTATSDRPIKLAGAPGIDWSPQASAIQWHRLESDVTPASEPDPRLRQFKALAKRFGSYQIFNPGMQREELRLLVQPLYRYSDAAQGIVDGAIFAFALGTNPEALLFLEACDEDHGESKWNFGLARRGSSAQIHVLLDEEEVWSVEPLGKVTREDPFCHFLRSLTGKPALAGP